jgi:ethanolamine ammonia-lyase small subunit
MSWELDSRRQLRAFTSARVGLGRTGASLPLREVLDFQRCHALARDAVHARLDAAALAADLEAPAREHTGECALRLRSKAMTRDVYLQRPDLGRRLDEGSCEALAEREAGHCDLAVVIADGLSALAVERHAVRLLERLLPLLAGWKLAPLCIVEQGRVAIGDAIGEALGAEIAAVLIGERPGLSAPDSLGAYVTWMPRRGRTDAERVCLSNIRVDGLGYDEAAGQLYAALLQARRLRMTGVAIAGGSQQLATKEPLPKVLR